MFLIIIKIIIKSVLKTKLKNNYYYYIFLEKC